jgi:hypothetical protein
VLRSRVGSDWIRMWPLSVFYGVWHGPELLDSGGFGFLAALILTSLLPARENIIPRIMGSTIVISCLS